MEMTLEGWLASAALQHEAWKARLGRDGLPAG